MKAQVARIIGDKLKQHLTQQRDQQQERAQKPEGTQKGQGNVPTEQSIELPPIDTVQARRADPTDAWSANEIRNRSGQHRTGTSRTIQPRDTKQDEKIGKRGEEIIYREEVKRVTAQGYSASRVIWVAKDNPVADHDIRSVDQNGQDLWIEVKSTTGRHGRFEWSPAEFELALRKREHYVLWRVYEADSTQPTIKPFCDPISLIIGGSMHIDVAALSAEVEPVEA